MNPKGNQNFEPMNIYIFILVSKRTKLIQSTRKNEKVNEFFITNLYRFKKRNLQSFNLRESNVMGKWTKICRNQNDLNLKHQISNIYKYFENHINALLLQS